ncbi:MAG TPA: hypothetical protein DCL43_16030 [Chitinophagaceae bacterium]|nr:hypothetical protein [Chitinophagaceae bacterium]
MKSNVGVGARVLSFLVDTILVFIVSMLIHRLHRFYVFYYKTPFIKYYWFFWGTLVLYYFAWELLTSRTPGKYISLTKVVTLNGDKPSVLQLFVRSVTRILLIDPFFIPFWGGTLHDKLSKTKVVEA